MRITAPIAILRTAILRIRLRTATLRIAILRTATARTILPRTAILRITTARISLPIRVEATADNLQKRAYRVADKLQYAEKSIRYLKERLQDTSCNLFYLIEKTV